MTPAVEANADGLIGPTHSYAGLSPGNLASTTNRGAVSNPRAAVLQGLEKMATLNGMGLPQFVLPPHERPYMPLLREMGFGGSDAQALGQAWREDPFYATAACSASSMWAANAATVTPSVDSGDGRVWFTPANLISNLHRSLEREQTYAALKRLFPDEGRFAVETPLPRSPHLADEGAANHVRLSAEQGAPGVNLFVYGRKGDEPWPWEHPARQIREASESIARRHGAGRAVFARQNWHAIMGGAFHNDVVCVGTRTCLFHHEQAFADTAAVHHDIRRAAEGLFEPVFVEVAESELPLADAIRSYLFNSMLVQPPGEDRLVLIAPVEVRETERARAVAEALPASNGPIGRIEYVDVRQSMRNGGGPACLRLRVVLTDEELAAANPRQRFTTELHAELRSWAERRYRDRLSPADLADPELIAESRTALDELTRIMDLGEDFYPFQRP